jgi:serine acetyltransferase
VETVVLRRRRLVAPLIGTITALATGLRSNRVMPPVSEPGGSALIGMGATVLNRARIGANCIVGAHALVTQGKAFPDFPRIVGAPAKAVRRLDPATAAPLRHSAGQDVANARRFAAGLRRIG